MYERIGSRVLAPVALLAIGTTASSPASAQFNCTYQGGVNDWSTAAAWNTDCNGTFPNNSGSDTYNATVNIGTVSLDQAITVQDLNLTNGAIGGNQQLTVVGVATFSSGDLQDDAVVRAEGGLQLNGAQNKQLFNNASLVNASGSSADWSEGNIQLVTATTSLVNESGATFNITGGGRSLFSSGLFDNQGNLSVNLSGPDETLAVAAAFDNSGAVDVQQGRFSINGGGTGSGSFTSGANGTVVFGGGSYQLTAASSVNGANVQFGGGTVTVDGSYNAADTLVTFGTADINVTGTTNTLSVTNGGLGGTGQLTVSGLTSFSAGDLTDDIVVRAEGGLQIDGASNKQLFNNASLVNASGETADWSEGGIQLVNAGTSLVNESGATFNITGGSRSLFSSGTFDNQGDVNVNLSSSDQILTMQAVFNSSGDVDVQQGRLSINGGGTSSGTITGGPDGAVVFGGGSYQLTASSSVNSANVEFTGGTVAVDGSYSATDTLVTFGNADINVSATTDTLAVTNGRLGGSGALTVSGLTTFSAGDLTDDMVVRAEGGLQIDGGANKQLFNNASLVNASGATGNWSEGSIQLVNTGTSLVNESGATLNITGGSRSLFSSGLFDNDGDVVVNLSPADQTLTVQAVVENDGVIDVQQGRLSLDGGGTSSGSFTGSASGIVDFGGSTHELAAASSVSGTNVEFTGGTTEINGSYDALSTRANFGTANFNVDASTAALDIENGAIGGTGQLTATGTTTFTGGDLVDDLVVRAEGGLEINGTANKQLFDQASLVIASGSTANWSEGSIQLVNPGTSIVNESGATFNVTGESRSVFSSGTIDNAGSMLVSLDAADETLTVSATIQNSGGVTVQQGSLQVSSATGNGDWAADGGSIAVSNSVSGPDVVTSGNVSADNGGTISVGISAGLETGDLVIGETGSLVQAASSTATVSGNFVLAATDESQLAIDPNSSLVMSGGVGALVDEWADWARLEIGGFDLGTDPDNNVGDPDGFIDNFSLAELVIGEDAQVFLTDKLDNGNRGGPQGLAEALYVDTVTFLDGDGTLNLNGFNLYFNTLVGDPGQIINTIVPVPPAVVLFFSALGLLGWVRRRTV